MIIDYKMIGKRIREKRHIQQISQACLAEEVDLSVSYISCIERAKKQVSLEALVRIANSLHTTVDDLLIGSQANIPRAFAGRWAELIADCSNDEKLVVYDTILALKNSLRDKFSKG